MVYDIESQVEWLPRGKFVQLLVAGIVVLLVAFRQQLSQVQQQLVEEQAARSSAVAKQGIFSMLVSVANITVMTNPITLTSNLVLLPEMRQSSLRLIEQEFRKYKHLSQQRIWRNGPDYQVIRLLNDPNLNAATGAYNLGVFHIISENVPFALKVTRQHCYYYFYD